MAVSACPLLRQLDLTDVCGAPGWISRGKLLVRVDIGDKVHIIFFLWRRAENGNGSSERGGDCDFDVRWRQKQTYSMWDITAQLLCVSEGIFLYSVTTALCWVASVFNLRTHPGLHLFVYVWGKEQNRLCHFEPKQQRETLMLMGKCSYRQKLKLRV